MTPTELIAWRKKNGLSQAKAAEVIGCSRRGIQLWESGENEIPKNIALAISAIQFNLPPYGKKS
jgi:transcriptional regulator with XRE-family HTH domain